MHAVESSVMFRYTQGSEDNTHSFVSHRQLYDHKNALKPSVSEFDGAVMVADIAGFTKLTEVLSKKGSSGVELLTNCINSYFGKVRNYS